jgi:gamma-glutamylcyclotransferase
MYYFAYGSNLNRWQMAERCPACQPRFTAELPNYRLIFTGWSRQWQGGVASIKPFRGDKVLGAVYELSEKDLPKLDKYEGYPDIYNRLKVTIYRDTGEAIEAITYIRKQQPEETKPSAKYLAQLKEGYLDWGLV